MSEGEQPAEKGPVVDEPIDEAGDEAGDGGSGPDSGAMKALLRKATTVPPPAPKQDLLHGVQRRLRQRSAGKFYNDGWSTREESPRSTYLVTAGVMLVLLVVVYMALIPGGIGKP